MSETIKFITDSNLGKLAKWLRILGYDTLYYSGNADRKFLTKAKQEDRVVLTRRKNMLQRSFSGTLAVIRHDCVGEQLLEVINQFAVKPEKGQFFTICLKCNAKLTAVSKEEIAGRVPDYVFRTHSGFYSCPCCGGVFWPGTHKDNIDRFLMTHRIPYQHA